MGEPTPLHVLLWVMRRKWREGDLDGAVALAKIAAPYLHAKVPARAPTDDLAGVTDEELERFDGDGGTGAAAEDPVEPG